MPRALLRILLLASAAAMAALVVVYRTLPPATTALSGALPSTIILGAYHIHSVRSDGSGSVEAIARAAHAAGLGFIVLTDHGDGTAAPLAPAYRSGVLCIDAVEVSTNGGHVVALGLNGAAPFPMAGEPADVIEDIHRRGGFAIVAHPDSPKPELQWRAWETPYDGVEWLNADSEWRDRTPWDLTAVAARLILRPPETIASLFRRPTVTLRRWDAVLRRRPVVGVAGLDAHANIAGWPRYVDMFKTLVEAAALDQPLTGRAEEDARAIVSALRAGHVYSIVRAFASPATLEFTADTGSATVHMGDWTPAEGDVTWRVRVPQAPNAQVVLVGGGREIARGRGSLTFSGSAVSGAYRVEVSYPPFSTPWIVSNPIYVGTPPADRVSVEPPPAPATDSLDVLGSSAWRVERDVSSTGQLVRDGKVLRFDYALGPGRPASQYAAAVVPVEATTGFDRVQFTMRADHPMRVSVQVRLPGGRGGQRWRRSTYVDDQWRAIVLPLSTFTPADRPTSQQPIASIVHELLVVVDTVNTIPGARGAIWMSAAGLGRESTLLSGPDGEKHH
jgi:hypothetical protein